MGQPGGKRLLLRPISKCKDNFRTDLEGMGWGVE
jgi:hypothetical protein